MELSTKVIHNVDNVIDRVWITQQKKERQIA